MILILDIAENKKRDIQLNQLETSTHYDSSLPHRHNYCEFVNFQKGDGTHTIDFIEFSLILSTYSLALQKSNWTFAL